MASDGTVAARVSLPFQRAAVAPGGTTDRAIVVQPGDNLWFIARDRFRRYVVMVSTTAMMAFATYALFPAAPPWMASEFGDLEPTTRSIGIIWSHIPIGNFDTLYEKGAAYSNQVAAVPSLHGAYTLLIALILWPLVPRWGRVLLALYPIAMTYALVYTAEHYVVDILLGWLYTVIAFFAVQFEAGREGPKTLGAGEPLGQRLLLTPARRPGG